MIIHSTKNNKDVAVEINELTEDIVIEKKTWLEFYDAKPETLKLISDKTNIPLDFLLSSLDEEESARIDNDEGAVLIVLDVPCKAEDGSDTYITNPFIIAYNDDYFITIDRFKTTLIQSFLTKTRSIQPAKHVRFTLNLIYQLSREFISKLRKIDLMTKDIEKRLHSATKNKEIFNMMDLNKSLVYFSTALSADKAVLAKLLKSQAYKKYEDDFELMEDTEVELNQAIEMCTIYRDILSGMIDSFASIISNNLNIVMKTLTVITIVISIPTLIASIYGMNVQLPLQDNKNGFIIVISVALFLSILCAIGLILITNKTRRK
jgi:magnesium transporter